MVYFLSRSVQLSQSVDCASVPDGWALKGFPESQVETENKHLDKARETLRAQKVELEKQIKSSQEAAISLPNLEHFVKIMQNKLAVLDFESKREVLDMLDIKVWLDGCVPFLGHLSPPFYEIITGIVLGGSRSTSLLGWTASI